MGEIVNLRLRRKAKARAEKERIAEENRVRFGWPKSEKERERRLSDLEQKRLEAHRLSRDEEDGQEA